MTTRPDQLVCGHRSKGTKIVAHFLSNGKRAVSRLPSLYGIWRVTFLESEMRIRHRLRITTSAIFLAVLIVSISSVCRATDSTDPAAALRDSVDKIADAVMVDLRAGRNTLSKQLAERLILTLLKAGRCDEAYEHMQSVPGESLQLYCRVMAEIGRADEVPKNVKSFQNSFPVRRLLADEDVSFDELCAISVQHGKALRCVSQGRFESAMEELRTLHEMQTFAGQFDGIAESVFIAIHRKAGAKACVTAIEKYSNDQPAKLKGVTRAVAVRLSTKELLDVIKLLPKKHLRTYLWEMSLIISNEQIDDSDKKLAIDDALEQLARVEGKDAIALKSYLLASNLVSAEQKNAFADDCVAWICRNPSQLALNRSVFKWLVSQSNWEKVEAIISSTRSSPQRAIIIGQLVKVMGKGNSSESVERVAAWLPSAAEASSVKDIHGGIPDFLIESGKLTLAEQWLLKVRDREEQQVLQRKLEFYRVLTTTEFPGIDVISAKFEAINKELSPSTKWKFQRCLGVDFLAEITVRAGTDTALSVARILPADSNGRFNPTGHCAAALLNRGESAAALEVLKFGTTQETESALLSDVDFNRMKPENRKHLRSKLAPFFPGDRRFNGAMIREAALRGDKARAFELTEAYFRRHGATPFWLGHHFTDHGWHDDVAALASRIEAQESRNNSNLKGMTSSFVEDAAWSLLHNSDQAGLAVVAFVKKHVQAPKDRVEIFLNLTSEFSLSR